MTFVLVIVGLLALYHAATAWVLGVRLPYFQFKEIVDSLQDFCDNGGELKLNINGFLIGYDKLLKDKIGLIGHAYLPSTGTIWVFYSNGRRAHFKR